MHRDTRGLAYDYGFRACPVRGLFPNKTHDPLYLCDEFGQPIAWADGTVLDLNAPPASGTDERPAGDHDGRA